VTPSENRTNVAGRGLEEGLRDLVSAYAARHSRWESEDFEVAVLDSEVMVAGRPGVVDVIADAGGRLVHLPIGLRAPGDEARFLPEADDPVLGVLEDDEGLAVATEAILDSELSTLLLHAVTGQTTNPALVRQIRADEDSVTLAMEDRLAFTMFTELVQGPRLGLEMLLALDEVGFNHVAAPVALWRRGDHDLGIVQEYLPGASTGWALALTSVRDLYGSGGPPEIAGGDFAGEARRLGTMAARMHLGLEEAFGRRDGDVGSWVRSIETAVTPLAPSLLERPDVEELLGKMRALAGPCRAIRTHGDFHLGRVYRNELGWYVGDLGPGGRPHLSAGTVPAVDSDDSADPAAGARTVGAVMFRSPLADVADMLWSFGLVARTAAHERDPTGREGLSELADAWEQRNRSAFLSGYLEVPGIGDLVPADEEAVPVLAAAFELERTATRMALGHVSGAEAG